MGLHQLLDGSEIHKLPGQVLAPEEARIDELEQPFLDLCLEFLGELGGQGN